VTVNGKTLVLNGMGLRQATFLRIEAYVGGLYLKNPTSDPDSGINSRQCKRVTQMFLRNIDGSRLRSGWADELRKDMIRVALIGYEVAGLGGALAVLIAFFLSARVLTFGANRLWHRFSRWPWRESIRRGLAPVTVGLMILGVISIGKTAIDAVGMLVLPVIVTVILLTTQLNPALLILGSAITGSALLR
jgi:hypothetical protein